MIVIEPLTPETAPTLKAVRLRALLDTPQAFGSTYAREVQFSEAEWAERARRWANTQSACYLAMDGNDAYGIAAGLLDSQDPAQAHLISMWVAPTHRGGGIGRRLVATVLDWAASSGAETLCLWVVSDNTRAIGFYDGLGFARTGETEPYANDPDLTEIAMSRPVFSAAFTKQDKRGDTPCSDY